MSKESKVKNKIYDILGSEVITLLNEEKQAGVYEVNFDGGGLTSGIYFYRLQAGNFVETKTMILLKWVPSKAWTILVGETEICPDKSGLTRGQGKQGFKQLHPCPTLQLHSCQYELSNQQKYNNILEKDYGKQYPVQTKFY